jgi:hypothetical protein
MFLAHYQHTYAVGRKSIYYFLQWARIILRAHIQAKYKYAAPVFNINRPHVESYCANFFIWRESCSAPILSTEVFFTSGRPHVEQQYTNLFIWRGSFFEPIFSTDRGCVEHQYTSIFSWRESGFEAISITYRPLLGRQYTTFIICASQILKAFSVHTFSSSKANMRISSFGANQV